MEEIKEIESIFDKENNILLKRYPKPKSLKNHVTIILFGWLGAKRRTLDKYAEVYWRHSVSTISSMRETQVFSNQSQVDSLYKMLCDQQAYYNSTDPVGNEFFLHLFSGNGMFLYSNLMRKIEKEKNTKLYDAIKGIVFDSAPPKIQSSTNSRAFSSQFMVHVWKQKRVTYSGCVYWTVYLFFYLASLVVMYCGCLCGLQWRRDFEYVMDVNVNKLGGIPILFIYSQKDMVVRPEEVEEYILRYRKAVMKVKNNNNNNDDDDDDENDSDNDKEVHIVRKKFKESGHVCHYLRYPREYWVTVQSFVRDVTGWNLLDQYNDE